MSTPNSDMMSFDSLGRREPTKRVKFDPTISLGHILTFVGLIIAGFGAWANMDKRVTLAEIAMAQSEQRDNAQDRAAEKNIDSLRADIKSLQSSVNNMNITLLMKLPQKP